MDTVEFIENGNVLVCRFSGKLDGGVCADIEECLKHRIGGFVAKRTDTPQIEFNLLKVEYVSSMFLRFCLIYCKSVGKTNFLLTNLSDNVHKVFHISGFTEMMQIN